MTLPNEVPANTAFNTGPSRDDGASSHLNSTTPRVLADHGDVLGVVDRELRSVAGGQCDEVDGGV